MASEQESSSDEDVPLSALAGKGIRNKKEGENQGDDSSEQEAEFGEGEYEEQGNESGNESAEDEGYAESDSDEDIPVSALKTRKKRAAAKPKAAPKAKKAKVTPKKKKKVTKKKTPTKKKATKKKVIQKDAASSNNLKTPSAQLYANSIKGKLIQNLLCRWWYAITWPEPESLPKEMPKNHDALDGFPGVYVATSGASVGKIMDCRNHDTAPNFKNMALKSSEELKELLLTAVEKQRELLIDLEGKGTATEKDLTKLEKWTNKISAAKAEKEAEKVLKAAGFSISA